MTTPITIPDWPDDEERRIFSWADDKLSDDPMYKATMRMADEITRSGLDPDEIRSRLSTLMDSANDEVFRRRYLHYFRKNSQIPVFTLLSPCKDRSTNAHYSQLDDIRVIGHCIVTKEEQDIAEVLKELFWGKDMFCGRSPDNSGGIYDSTEIPQRWEEAKKGISQRVPRDWVWPISSHDCRLDYSVYPTNCPTKAKLMGLTSFCDDLEELDQDGRDYVHESPQTWTSKVIGRFGVRHKGVRADRGRGSQSRGSRQTSRAK